jgi:hypothetical protein
MIGAGCQEDPLRAARLEAADGIRTHDLLHGSQRST